MKQARIIPSITTDDKNLFESQLAGYLKFSECLHIDFADGTITPNKLLSLDEISWPKEAKIWLHVMAHDPFIYLERIIKLKPARVIFPFDISFDNPLFACRLREAGIESGVYLSSADEFEDAKWQLAHFQEAMIFAGDLGHQGAEANLNLLDLGPKLKRFAPFIDLGWDGGINLHNILKVKNSGFKNIVSGGYISSSDNHQNSFARLKQLVV